MNRLIGSPFRRTLSSTVVGNLANQGLGVISGVLVARLLGPVGRGELAAVFVYPAVLAQIGILSIEQAACQRVCRQPQRRADIASSAFWLSFGVACCEAIAAILLVPRLLPHDKAHLFNTVRWFCLFPIAAIVSQTLMQIDLAAGRHLRFNILRVLPSLIYVTALVICAFAGAVTVTLFVLCNLAAHFVVLLLRMALCREEFRLSPDPPLMTSILADGLRFHVPQLAAIAFSRLDMLLALFLLPTASLGHYAVASAIAAGQAPLAGAFVQLAFVQTARSATLGSGYPQLWRHFAVAAAAGVGSMAVLLVIAPYVIAIAFGNRFLPALATARWLIVMYPLLSLTQLLDAGLRALGRTLPGVSAYVTGAALSIVLGLLVLRVNSPATLAAVFCAAWSASLGIVLGCLCSAHCRAQKWAAVGNGTSGDIADSSSRPLPANRTTSREERCAR